MLQSALGNLPELFVCLFALHSGLYDVVRAALVGSVLSNVLLVLGLAFVVGGLKFGTQQLRRGASPRDRAAPRAVGVALRFLPDASLAHAGGRAREVVVGHRVDRAAGTVRAVPAGFPCPRRP